jgi:hypothetical protein
MRHVLDSFFMHIALFMLKKIEEFCGVMLESNVGEMWEFM